MMEDDGGKTLQQSLDAVGAITEQASRLSQPARPLARSLQLLNGRRPGGRLAVAQWRWGAGDGTSPCWEEPDIALCLLCPRLEP